MSQEVIPAIAAVVVRGDKIGCFLRGKNRSFRPGELDGFMGGEIQVVKGVRESPSEALDREFREKVSFSGGDVEECGEVDLSTTVKTFWREVLILKVPGGVEPVFDPPLPNHKFEQFLWLDLDELRQKSSQGLSPESWLILNLVFQSSESI